MLSATEPKRSGDSCVAHILGHLISIVTGQKKGRVFEPSSNV